MQTTTANNPCLRCLVAWPLRQYLSVRKFEMHIEPEKHNSTRPQVWHRIPNVLLPVAHLINRNQNVGYEFLTTTPVPLPKKWTAQML
jgi:hypothetical protein